MTRQEIPLVDPPFDGDPADVSVAGILLAAGASSRFGEANKLLATVGGEPLVRRALRPLLDAELARTVVVVGHEADAVRAAVADSTVTVVENGDFERGLSTSVRRGLSAARATAGESLDAVLFALGDMPDVSPGTVERLVAAFESGVGDPLVAARDGRRGNPVLFGRDHFDRLAAVDGDSGGRGLLLSADGTRLVETGDPGVLRDVDRPGDL